MSAPRRCSLIVALVCAVALTAAACGTPVPGSLLHTPRNPRVALESRHRLAVAPPRDLRPLAELHGDDPKTSFFFTLIFLWWTESRGNWVSSAFQSSPEAARELAELQVRYLRRAGPFAHVAPLAQGHEADFLLESDLLHLYGTHYEAKRSIVAIRRSSFGSSVHTSRRKVNFAVYGNAVIRYRLFDLRGGKRKLVWKRSLRGGAQLAPGPKSRARLGEAAHLASARSLSALARQLTHAMLDYAQPPFDAQVFDAHLNNRRAAKELRFVVQRVSRFRSAKELLTIDDASGRVIDHRVVHSAGVPMGRPGDWMLSRERLDGTLMPYREYAALAAYLSSHYDLRRLDEAYHFHFFGRRRGAPTHVPSPAPPETATGKPTNKPTAQPASSPKTAEPGVIDIHETRR